MLERAGQILHNETELHIEATITNKPPARGDVYSATAGIIPLLDEGGNSDNIALVAVKLAPDPLVGDINLDGKVNDDDVNVIFAARNTPALPNDPRDLNSDGSATTAPVLRPPLRVADSTGTSIRDVFKFAFSAVNLSH